MKHYQHNIQEVLDHVQSTTDGLTSAEAKKRLEANGKNKLAEAKKTSLFVKFLKQLTDPMIIILLVAAAVSLVLTLVEQTGEFADVIIIVAVVLLNAILGVAQESKAEAAIAALQSMTEAKCKVIRDGNMMYVDSCDLVVGDIVLLEAGDVVPADLRLLESYSLKCDEVF